MLRLLAGKKKLKRGTEETDKQADDSFVWANLRLAFYEIFIIME